MIFNDWHTTVRVVGQWLSKGCENEILHKLNFLADEAPTLEGGKKVMGLAQFIRLLVHIYFRNFNRVYLKY